MLLAICAGAYSPPFVHFVAPVKNNVIENSLFSRIVYSTDHYTMNGLYLKRHTLAQVQGIELDLLNAYGCRKPRGASLGAHYMTHSILKISGVWESETAFGLAYKFIHL